MSLLITFSGVDGAGKSTQIENLCRAAEELGLRVRRLAFWDDVVVLKPWREGFVHKVLKSEPGIGTPERPVNRRDKNVRRWYLTVRACTCAVTGTTNARWRPPSANGCPGRRKSPSSLPTNWPGCSPPHPPNRRRTGRRSPALWPHAVPSA